MTSGSAAVNLEGVVVHLRALGESSRVVELVTREAGRIALVARGVRRSRKRFQGAIDLFVSLRVQATVKPGLWNLEGVDVINPRLAIRSSLERLSLASFFTELTYQLMPEQQRAQRIFDAYLTSLDAVDGNALDKAMAVLPAMLNAAGILPSPDHCLRCGIIEPIAVAPLIVEGGWICADCARGTVVTPAAFWRGEGAGLNVQGREALLRAAAAWVQGHTGRELKSLRLWQSGSRTLAPPPRQAP